MMKKTYWYRQNVQDKSYVELVGRVIIIHHTGVGTKQTRIYLKDGKLELPSLVSYVYYLHRENTGLSNCKIRTTLWTSWNY